MKEVRSEVVHKLSIHVLFFLSKISILFLAHGWYVNLVVKIELSFFIFLKDLKQFDASPTGIRSLSRGVGSD